MWKRLADSGVSVTLAHSPEWSGEFGQVAWSTCVSVSCLQKSKRCGSCQTARDSSVDTSAALPRTCPGEGFSVCKLDRWKSLLFRRPSAREEERPYTSKQQIRSEAAVAARRS